MAGRGGFRCRPSTAIPTNQTGCAAHKTKVYAARTSMRFFNGRESGAEAAIVRIAHLHTWPLLVRALDVEVVSPAERSVGRVVGLCPAWLHERLWPRRAPPALDSPLGRHWHCARSTSRRKCRRTQSSCNRCQSRQSNRGCRTLPFRRRRPTRTGRCLAQGERGAWSVVHQSARLALLTQPLAVTVSASDQIVCRSERGLAQKDAVAVTLVASDCQGQQGSESDSAPTHSLDGARRNLWPIL